MGNITTHKNIALHIMRELRDAASGHPGAYRPEDEWFFELGNWLTDMSQLRDPAAFIGAKLTVWNKKFGISLTNAAAYLDRIMGRPKPNGQSDRDYLGEFNGTVPGRNATTDDGRLAVWLRELVFAWGYETFVHRGKHLSEAHYKDIFDIFYTQYYPHEHLDCPTMPGGTAEQRAIGERVGSLVAKHACDQPPMAPGKRKQSGGAGAADAWVRILLQDEHGHPLSNVALRMHPRQGASRDLTTDAGGMVEVTGLAPATTFTLTCPISGQGSDEARLERSWSTAAISAAGHPIDPTPAGPPGKERKFVLRVEAVKPAATDSLKTLAARAGISWQELARFNFGTDDPAKINDALRDRVGCHAKVDQQNYRFAGDEKGVMYLPHLWEQEALGVNQVHSFKATRADGRPVRAAQGKAGAKKGTGSGGGSSSSSSSSSGSTRALLAYLDEQIEYLADLLTFIEFHWKALARENLSEADRMKRRRLLVLFGHACHAIEDFYFHSNFVELTWKKLGRDLPARWRNQAERERHQRVFHRRLRSPVAKGSGLDPDKSDKVTHLFTGFFGGTDVFHTVIDALDGLNEKLQLDDPRGLMAKFPQAGPLLQGRSTADLSRQLESDASNLTDAKVKARMAIPEYEALVVLWDTLGWVASANRRERLREDDPTNAIGSRHQARLLNGTYDRVFATLQKHQMLHATSVGAIKRAFQIDRDLIFNAAGQIRPEWERGVNLPAGILGTFAFLLTLALTAETEHHESEEKSLNFDRAGMKGDRDDEVWNGTNNKASAEIIGSHSLMAKDSPHKEPLREPAVNIATRVSCFVARTMAAQVVAHKVNVARFDSGASGSSQAGTFNTLNRGRCVDWLHLLQHFLCHPAECEHGWHVESMDLTPSLDNYRKHNTHYIIRRIDIPTRDQRMKQANRNRLDKEYHGFEQDSERAWRAR
ncbi:MAG: hypothetical protein KDA21_08685 [Phycisphaerales bacterium]|nr:hypothetical protein [Phycisphaerales bacterium]